MTEVRDLYPTYEPNTTGMLDLGEGNHMFWQDGGLPSGTPALVVHGGPGAGCAPILPRFMDPNRYRIITADQRNCGRSTPNAADHDTDLTCLTTHQLIDDFELLRGHLGIERWVLFGVSWGSTLSLTYAEAHPNRIAGIVLGAVTTTSNDELAWLYGGVRHSRPDAWERFRHGAGPAMEEVGVIEAYRRLLNHEDPGVRARAARDWCAWEEAVVSDPDEPPQPTRFADARFRLCFARIVTHVFANGAWLADRQILRDVTRLEGIPGMLVHGRDDLSSGLSTAEGLAAAWPDATLVVVPGGHGVADQPMCTAVLDAADRIADLVE